MELLGIDHVTIRIHPDQVEPLRAFYADVLGLRVGPRRLTFPGIWLYYGDQAILHVAGNLAEPGGPGPTDTAGLDHIAFRTKGLAASKTRLDAAAIAWREVWRPEQGVLQLILHDPAGTKVELAFDPAEHSDAKAVSI